MMPLNSLAELPPGLLLPEFQDALSGGVHGDHSHAGAGGDPMLRASRRLLPEHSVLRVQQSRKKWHNFATAATHIATYKLSLPMGPS